MNLKLNLIIFLILSISSYYSAIAQTEKTAYEELFHKIEELEKQIQKLESRISVIENIPVTEKNKKTSSSISKGNYKIKGNWRLLKQEMTQNHVKELLGEPGQISKFSFGNEIWFYPNGSGGHVKFDEKGTVEGWEEP